MIFLFGKIYKLNSQLSWVNLKLNGLNLNQFETNTSSCGILNPNEYHKLEGTPSINDIWLNSVI